MNDSFTIILRGDLFFLMKNRATKIIYLELWYLSSFFTSFIISLNHFVYLCNDHRHTSTMNKEVYMTPESEEITVKIENNIMSDGTVIGPGDEEPN